MHSRLVEMTQEGMKSAQQELQKPNLNPITTCERCTRNKLKAGKSRSRRSKSRKGQVSMMLTWLWSKSTSRNWKKPRRGTANKPDSGSRGIGSLCPVADGRQGRQESDGVTGRPGPDVAVDGTSRRDWHEPRNCPR